MSPLILVAVAAVSTGGTPCFVGDDTSPGWKAVHLPTSAPELAAPKGVPQFRGGTPAEVTYTERDGLLNRVAEGRLKTHYELSLPHGAREATLELGKDLRGAKVDAVLWAGGRNIPLLDEKRMTGKKIHLSWSFADVSSVVVTVHHHLRSEPIVERWRFVTGYDVVSAHDTPPAFREERVLYYLQPPGPAVQLCQAPGRTQAVARADVRGEPKHVALLRLAEP